MMWIESKQNGILVNLENIADVVIQAGQGEFVVKCYTHSGFGMVIFKGTEKDCVDKKEVVSNLVKAQEV